MLYWCFHNLYLVFSFHIPDLLCSAVIISCSVLLRLIIHHVLLVHQHFIMFCSVSPISQSYSVLFRFSFIIFPCVPFCSVPLFCIKLWLFLRFFHNAVRFHLHIPPLCSMVSHLVLHHILFCSTTHIFLHYDPFCSTFSSIIIYFCFLFCLPL